MGWFARLIEWVSSLVPRGAAIEDTPDEWYVVPDE